MTITQDRCTTEGCTKPRDIGTLCGLHYSKPAPISTMRRTYAAMMSRCFDRSHKDYPHYGGRGISVCARWVNGDDNVSGYQCFVQDMGIRPEGKYSLDRKDNNQDYSPDNCHWADSIAQNINRRKPYTNTSGSKGVYRNGRYWRVQIRIVGKQYEFGNYVTVEEAATIRDSVIQQIYGSVY